MKKIFSALKSSLRTLFMLAATLPLISFFPVASADCISRYKERTNKSKHANQSISTIVTLSLVSGSIGVLGGPVGLIAGFCAGAGVGTGIAIKDQIKITKLRQVRRILQGAHIFMADFTHSVRPRTTHKAQIYLDEFTKMYQKAANQGMSGSIEEYAQRVVQADQTNLLCKVQEGRYKFVKPKDFLERSVAMDFSNRAKPKTSKWNIFGGNKYKKVHVN
jgi:hypothetical protein